MHVNSHSKSIISKWNKIKGNTKVFFADQRITTCPEYPNEEGDIEGIYEGIFDTKTELVGKENALLYQVFYQGCVFQSQLTTLTENNLTGDMYRVRSAQGFECFNPAMIGSSRYVSYYRERKVSKEVFYNELENYLQEYNILESDTCAWDSFGNPSPYVPGCDSCMQHLEQSFEPFDEFDKKDTSKNIFDKFDGREVYDAFLGM